MSRRSEQAVQQAQAAANNLNDQASGQRMTGQELHAQRLRDIGWDLYDADTDGSGVAR